MNYRSDIDGLRALAVVSVILFHLGILPNGYLGVDVFFVISGYLITSIVYNESENNKFSILKFYERRIRRIIPLTLVVTSCALILGLLLMLPDDLENTAQAVVASNFSVNNILMYITSSDYWAVKNDYKPLMHTWSLGIEEQFYLLYPFLFFFLKGKKLKYVKYVLLILTMFSLFIFLKDTKVAAKFYFIQYRFFELCAGGLGAIYFKNLILAHNNKFKFVLYATLFSIAFILFFDWNQSNNVKTIATTILTVILLVIGKQFFSNDKFYNILFSNKIITFVGKISFSLYMWHQIVFAFARYAFVDEITVTVTLLLGLLILVLSIISFYTIENTFRDRKLMSTKLVLSIVSILFLMSTLSAFYVYSIGGVVKDFPSLGLYKERMPNEINFFDSKDNIHIHYNEKVRKLSTDFDDNGKKNILVIGNSFGRDAVNVLIESKFYSQINVSYFDIQKVYKDESIIKRWAEADVILIAAKDFIGKEFLNEMHSKLKLKIDLQKTWIFGTKDFGYSNGIHYNKISEINNFNDYRSDLRKGVVETNHLLKQEWSDHYIDLIELVIDKNDKILIFTPQGKFISQDTLHFTEFGAQFFAQLLENKLETIIFN